MSTTQSPVAGRTVREGQSVTLTVSLGIHYVTVPDLTNYVQADGEQQLKDLGVSVLVTQAVDESVAAGSIIRTDPAAGSQVAAGTTVVIYVSRPQVATTTKVPSLIGMNVNDARTLLVQRKLGLGSQTEQYSDQPVGTVISQNPAAGSTTKLNGRVNIVVSAGPEPAPEPEAPSDSTTGALTARIASFPTISTWVPTAEYPASLQIPDVNSAIYVIPAILNNAARYTCRILIPFPISAGCPKATPSLARPRNPTPMDAARTRYTAYSGFSGFNCAASKTAVSPRSAA